MLVGALELIALERACEGWDNDQTIRASERKG